jgi:hypothetical protein
MKYSKLHYFLSPFILLVIGASLLSFSATIATKPFSDAVASLIFGPLLIVFAWVFYFPLLILYSISFAIYGSLKPLGKKLFPILNSTVYGLTYAFIGPKTHNEYWYVINFSPAFIVGLIGSYFVISATKTQLSNETPPKIA